MNILNWKILHNQILFCRLKQTLLTDLTRYTVGKHDQIWSLQNLVNLENVNISSCKILFQALQVMVNWTSRQFCFKNKTWSIEEMCRLCRTLYDHTEWSTSSINHKPYIHSNNDVLCAYVLLWIHLKILWKLKTKIVVLFQTVFQLFI